VSDDTIAEALKARITAYTKAPTLDLDEVKALATLPAYYAEFYLSRRSVDNPPRVGGTFDPNGRRLSVRAVAKTISNCRNLEAGVWAALLNNPITLDGVPVDVRYESGGGNFEADDEGWYTALTDFIFVR
jgi:hypothetical protein